MKKDDLKEGEPELSELLKELRDRCDVVTWAVEILEEGVRRVMEREQRVPRCEQSKHCKAWCEEPAPRGLVHWLQLAKLKPRDGITWAEAQALFNKVPKEIAKVNRRA